MDEFDDILLVIAAVEAVAFVDDEVVISNEELLKRLKPKLESRPTRSVVSS